MDNTTSGTADLIRYNYDWYWFRRDWYGMHNSPQMAGCGAKFRPGLSVGSSNGCRPRGTSTRFLCSAHCQRARWSWDHCCEGGCGLVTGLKSRRFSTPGPAGLVENCWTYLLRICRMKSNGVNQLPISSNESNGTIWDTCFLQLEHLWSILTVIQNLALELQAHIRQHLVASNIFKPHSKQRQHMTRHMTLLSNILMYIYIYNIISYYIHLIILS